MNLWVSRIMYWINPLFIYIYFTHVLYLVLPKKYIIATGVKYMEFLNKYICGFSAYITGISQWE